MRQDIVVIDNFLDKPDKVRQSILDAGEELFVNTGHYSGRRTNLVDDGYRKMIDSKIEEVLPFKIKMDTDNTSTYSFQLALEDDVTWVHQDNTNWSGVLYLTPNAPIDSGTLFFKEGSEPNPDEDDYGDYIVDHIGNIYNRMLLFRGYNLPHRSNIAGFGDCLENGRLSQHFFFDEVK